MLFPLYLNQTLSTLVIYLFIFHNLAIFHSYPLKEDNKGLLANYVVGQRN